MNRDFPHPALGQADSVLASLERQNDLSISLRLEIEEAVETAWELAYRPPATTGAVVVAFRRPPDRLTAERRDQ